jgi:ketosteroid isomerase-like protein
VTGAADPVAVVEAFLGAFNAGDLTALRACLADDAVASVTGPDGGPVEMAGGQAYVAAVELMNLPAVDYSVTLTQAPVLVGDGLVLVMVEVRARRDGGELHNFAAHLIGVAAGRITRMWMVEAKPAASDAFWG